MNNELDIDLDKLFDEQNTIKPLSEGLGFHHSVKEEKEFSKSIKKQAKSLESELSHRNKALARNKKPSGFGQRANMGDLSAFYDQKVPDKKEINKIQNVKISESQSSNIQEGSLFVRRFLSFAIDLIAIGFIFASIFTISFVLSGLPSNIFLTAFISQGLVLEGISLYSLLFIFYFSFFDKTQYSTIGKSILGIRLVSLDEKLSYYQTLTRSLVLLLGILTLGLSSMLGINDIISKTSIQKS